MSQEYKKFKIILAEEKFPSKRRDQREEKVINLSILKINQKTRALLVLSLNSIQMLREKERGISTNLEALPRKLKSKASRRNRFTQPEILLKNLMVTWPKNRKHTTKDPSIARKHRLISAISVTTAVTAVFKATLPERQLLMSTDSICLRSLPP